ncbi:unnamed protein product [Durusdinium trenchii]|uniref:SRSF protein kinase 1 n=2 Tax=Durusdinium trenchii TaxID=1381693 RepID=A0ABP0MCR2_9DINO
MASLATVLLLLASAFAQEAQVAPVDLEADALDEAQSTDTAARTSAVAAGGEESQVGPIAPNVDNCYREGWGYEDSWHKELNGGFVSNAQTCQETCNHMWFCDVFTYYTDTKKCFLQGNQAIEMMKPTAISGPKTCSATSLSEALKMTDQAAVNAARDAQAAGKNLHQIKIDAAMAANKNGVLMGLSNTQKAQTVAGVVGGVAAMSAAGDGNSVTPQIAAAARAAADFADTNHTRAYQAQQAMYAAGGIAGVFSKSRDETVQDRCDYAVREALDAADTVHGHGLSQEQQLIIAAQEGALVVATAGATKKETYTAVDTALRKVAAVYKKDLATQEQWAAIGEAAALEWWEESFTKDTVTDRLDFKDILHSAQRAGEEAQKSGSGLDDAVLAAAQAARTLSKERGYDEREQARQASIAGANFAASLPGDLEPRAMAAQAAAHKVATECGLPEATASTEGKRAYNLVMHPNQEKAAVDAEETKAGVAGGAVSAGFRGAEDEGLAGAELGAAGEGSSHGNNLLMDGAIFVGILLAAIACCILIYMGLNHRKQTPTKKKRHIQLKEEVEDEEQQPLMSKKHEAEPVAAAPAATAPNLGYLGGPNLQHLAVPITTAAPLVTPTFPAAAVATAPPRSGTLASSLGTVAPTMGTYRVSTSSPMAYPVNSYILDGAPAQPLVSQAPGVQIATTSFAQPSLQPVLMQEQQLPTGQIPVTAHLNVGHEVKQISYQEWHDAWRPGLPRDVVFTIPEGAIEGAPLIVEVEAGIVVPTTVPQGAYPGALACLQR